ncbi:Uncharacterized protein Adt_16525 [Abeliophyllum distichum]|uniref:Uncharacterized protein n=1 Tax=Abeliophyllum distichum TaxID=126358 RepID=A0ABD1TDX7_9LAMI
MDGGPLMYSNGSTNLVSHNEERAEVPLPINLEAVPVNNACEEGTEGSSQQTGARPTSSSFPKQQSKKRRNSDIMVEMMTAMAENIGRIADALTASNQSVCLDELFEMVQNIPGFDDDLVIEACEFLSFDEKRATMFLKLDERLRKLWLLKRLRGTKDDHWFILVLVLKTLAVEAANRGKVNGQQSFFCCKAIEPTSAVGSGTTLFYRKY